MKVAAQPEAWKLESLQAFNAQKHPGFPASQPPSSFDSW
ncbi:hypothetical protein D1AOALGA4SA_6265 [Olavius algarvensis Delta 1 endosymbiont]|nr:hypothetical protein D1AOALGA4SA_6265 [Olavius algarvensis Delta 1 endosymbiont]